MILADFVFWTSYAKLKVHSIDQDDMIVEIAGRRVTIGISEGTVVEEYERRVESVVEQKAGQDEEHGDIE